MNRDQLIADLKADEGWRSTVYADNTPEGWLTLGYGFVVDPRKGGGLPREIGDLWLQFLVDQLVPSLRRALPRFDTYPEPVQRALCNMAYQLGLRGLLGFRLMLAAIDRGDYHQARREALDSRWAIQTPGRAHRVADLIGNVAQVRA